MAKEGHDWGLHDPRAPEERRHPYMTSPLRGEGVSPKDDVVREVA